MNTLAAIIVALSGLWLIGLGIAAFTNPERVKDFFGKFASSAFTHFLEMFIRITAGTAFVIHAPLMKFSVVFSAFGWLLILTTAILFFVPWKLHKRFADRSLPLLTNRMVLFGTVSLVGGLFILVSFFLGLDAW
jgi:hypothetical protein